MQDKNLTSEERVYKKALIKILGHDYGQQVFQALPKSFLDHFNELGTKMPNMTIGDLADMQVQDLKHEIIDKGDGQVSFTPLGNHWIYGTDLPTSNVPQMKLEKQDNKQVARDKQIAQVIPETRDEQDKRAVNDLNKQLDKTTKTKKTKKPNKAKQKQDDFEFGL